MVKEFELKEFELTDEQLKTLMDACKPVPYMVFGGREPRSPQENANDAWRELGRELGFDYLSVCPIRGKSNKFFRAKVVLK